MHAFVHGHGFLAILSAPAIIQVCQSCGGLSPLERIPRVCSVLPAVTQQVCIILLLCIRAGKKNVLLVLFFVSYIIKTVLGIIVV
jgi:hypothetical protein